MLITTITHTCVLRFASECCSQTTEGNRPDGGVISED